MARTLMIRRQKPNAQAMMIEHFFHSQDKSEFLSNPLVPFLWYDMESLTLLTSRMFFQHPSVTYSSSFLLVSFPRTDQPTLLIFLNQPISC